MNIVQLLDKLEAYEANGKNPPDGRRVISDERVALQARLQRAQEGQVEWSEVTARAAEARRVLALWEHLD